jgi:NitT/TauT family transport system substrate-binding protein
MERKERAMSRLLSVAVMAVALCAAAAGHAQAPVRMSLDFAIQGQQSPFVLAADGGYFDKAGVKVAVDRGYGSADAITKVASGAYDMAFADLGVMIQFNGRQPASGLISVFQVYDVAPMVVLALKKSGITKPTDLAGKKIASPPGASSRVMFPLLAAAAGLDLASIQWVDVTPQLRETLLAQGQADASAALITDLAGLGRLHVSADDVNVMRYGDFGVALYGHGILTTPEFAARNPDTVRKVVKGFAEALKASIKDPGLAIAAIKKREPLVDEQVERIRLQSVIDNAIMTEHVRRMGLSAVEGDRLEKTLDMVTTVFKLPPADVKSVYTGAYLPPREDLIVR